MSKPGIVLNSNQDEIEKLKRKWTKVKNVGDGILAFGSAGFVGSVLSPFDFEGPVVEIITGALALGGFITKKIGENHLEELEGTSAKWNDEDREELARIQQNIEQATQERRERKNNYQY